MRFIVNVASPSPASFPGHQWQVICPYVPLTIHVFPLLCVVRLPMFLLFSVSLLESCAVSGVAKRARCFPKRRKIDSECRKYNELASGNEPYTFI